MDDRTSHYWDDLIKEKLSREPYFVGLNANGLIKHHEGFVFGEA